MQPPVEAASQGIATFDPSRILDEAGKLFRILIFKSTLRIPYTSVLLELDCGYWSEDAEKRLRSAQQSKQPRRSKIDRWAVVIQPETT